MLGLVVKKQNKTKKRQLKQVNKHYVDIRSKGCQSTALEKKN